MPTPLTHRNIAQHSASSHGAPISKQERTATESQRDRSFNSANSLVETLRGAAKNAKSHAVGMKTMLIGSTPSESSKKRWSSLTMSSTGASIIRSARAKNAEAWANAQRWPSTALNFTLDDDELSGASTASRRSSTIILRREEIIEGVEGHDTDDLGITLRIPSEVSLPLGAHQSFRSAGDSTAMTRDVEMHLEVRCRGSDLSTHRESNEIHCPECLAEDKQNQNNTTRRHPEPFVPLPAHTQLPSPPRQTKKTQLKTFIAKTFGRFGKDRLSQKLPSPRSPVSREMITDSQPSNHQSGIQVTTKERESADTRYHTGHQSQAQFRPYRPASQDMYARMLNRKPLPPLPTSSESVSFRPALRASRCNGLQEEPRTLTPVMEFERSGKTLVVNEKGNSRQLERHGDKSLRTTPVSMPPIRRKEIGRNARKHHAVPLEHASVGASAIHGPLSDSERLPSPLRICMPRRTDDDSKEARQRVSIRSRKMSERLNDALTIAGLGDFAVDFAAVDADQVQQQQQAGNPRALGVTGRRARSVVSPSEEEDRRGGRRKWRHERMRENPGPISGPPSAQRRTPPPKEHRQPSCHGASLIAPGGAV